MERENEHSVFISVKNNEIIDVDGFLSIGDEHEFWGH